MVIAWRDGLPFGVIIPLDYAINMPARWGRKSSVSLGAFKSILIFAFLEEANNWYRDKCRHYRPKLRYKSPEQESQRGSAAVGGNLILHSAFCVMSVTLSQPICLPSLAPRSSSLECAADNDTPGEGVSGALSVLEEAAIGNQLQ